MAAASLLYIINLYGVILSHRSVEQTTTFSHDNDYCMWLYSLICVVPVRTPSDWWLTPIVGCTDTVSPLGETA